MLTYRTQNKLAVFIKSIAEAEKRSELIRQVLAENPLFEPHTTFRRLDNNRDTFIKKEEIEDFLNDNKVYFTSREI